MQLSTGHNLDCQRDRIMTEITLDTVLIKIPDDLIGHEQAATPELIDST